MNIKIALLTALSTLVALLFSFIPMPSTLHVTVGWIFGYLAAGIILFGSKK